jgi:hypothetical protein
MLFLASVVVALLAGPDPAIGAITSSLQSILRNTHGSTDYRYPTDLTRDLLPVSLSVISYIDKLCGDLHHQEDKVVNPGGHEYLDSCSFS